jgi:uncharacterized protein YjbI with pentapeptide repeats
MANEEHVARLKKGVVSWNVWRDENRDVRPYLRGADLRGANLQFANLEGADLGGANLAAANLFEANLGDANLGEANLSKAYFGEANLGGADLRRAVLREADLRGADIREADLHEADLSGANLIGADLWRADLNGANLRAADLIEADLSGANLGGADLSMADLLEANLKQPNLRAADLREAGLIWVNLSAADLSEANLSAADLSGATLVGTHLRGADLTGCRIYGVSAWRLRLEVAKQQDLIITPEGKPEITVDNIEVAQFIFLLLQNKKIRDVIDTVGRKAVLILGRFTDERKAVLDALREELRKRDYLPILFDFDVPATRDITETVSLLARMARFIIADLTDPSSIPKELEAIVPSLAVPVQPLLEGASRPYAMFKDYWKYDWVLPVYRYEGIDDLLAALADKVIAPAEAKVKALEDRKRTIEAELIKPR